MKICLPIPKKTILAILVAGLGGFGGSTAMAANDCQKFTLVSDITLTLFPVPSGFADAELVLEDGTIFSITGEGIITEMKTSDEGIIHITLEELDSWGTIGTSIGLDTIKLTPTAIPGEFSLKIKTELIGESGDIQDTMGKYHGTGTASFASLVLSHSGKGRICNLP